MEVDWRKVIDSTPKVEQKLSANDRNKGLVRTCQELLFARSKMDPGRATLDSDNEDSQRGEFRRL